MASIKSRSFWPEWTVGKVNDEIKGEKLTAWAGAAEGMMMEWYKWTNKRNNLNAENG